MYVCMYAQCLCINTQIGTAVVVTVRQRRRECGEHWCKMMPSGGAAAAADGPL